MKSLKRMLFSLLVAWLIPVACQAAVSASQTWSFEGGYIKNTMSGVIRCVTTEGVMEPAVLGTCGAHPNEQQFNHGYWMTFQLASDQQQGLLSYGDDVYDWWSDNPIVEFDTWNIKGGQIISPDREKCLDIIGGKNVDGAKLYVATCTK